MSLNLLRAILTICIVTIVSICLGQDGVRIQKDSRILSDTATNRLIGALNSFLVQKEKPNKENKYISPANLLETSALLDELKGIEENEKTKDAGFYEPYLTAVLKQNDSTYTIQLAYMGIADGTAVLKTTIKLLVTKAGNSYTFSSPLKQNTANWHRKQKGYVTFCFKDKLDNRNAKAFIKAVTFYDKKLKATSPIVQYYCDNFLEAQELLGLDYKKDYAGVLSNNLTANEKNTSLIINGWNSGKNRFDPHDLFHDRLRTVMNAQVINRPVDEGCAYLYGGSWGKTWQEIGGLFKVYVKNNPNADWLQLYPAGTNFYIEDGKSFKISYMINALIVQELEKGKGFAGVMELLSCGSKQLGDDNYFKALNKIAGINKGNFNERVGGLIKVELAKQDD